MSEFLIQTTISNLIVSAVLAGLAWSFQRSDRSVVIANLLWTIVLLKMVTPPLFSLPMIEASKLSTFVQSAPSIKASTEAGNDQSGLLLESQGTIFDDQNPAQINDNFVKLQANQNSTPPSAWVRFTILVWLVISTFLLIVSLCRIICFEILLRSNSQLAPKSLENISRNLAIEMGLRKPPNLYVSNAQITPFVWWLGGRPRIIISANTCHDLDDDELRMVLAHEMAHLKRHDHWIRWVEYFAGLLAWWNPLLWWTRRHLRITEEIACDELVIRQLRLKPSAYANTLLNMAELLSAFATRPPAVASGINSGGILEQRLNKIMSRKHIVNPSWLRPTITLMAICVIPLGLVYAQDYDAVERRLGGAVEAGELTIAQANSMLEVLKQNSGDSQDLKKLKLRYAAIAQEFESAVESGKLSKEDAKEKLIALRKKMFQQDDSDDRERKHSDMDDRKKKYVAVAREIEIAIKQGKVTKEDAEKKLIALRKEMFSQAESDDRKKKYIAAARKIEAAVKEGDVSKKDAAKKLAEMQKSMFGRGESDDRVRERERDRDDRDMDDRKKKYMAAARKIEAAVKEGDVSKKDAAKKLAEMQKSMFRRGESDDHVRDRERDRDDRDMDDRKKKYITAARKIEAAVKEGDVSKKDAAKKLAEMQKSMFRQGESDDRVRDRERDRDDRDMDDRKKKYMAAARKIEAAVKEGDVSKKDAAKKLAEMRESMFRQGESDDRVRDRERDRDDRDMDDRKKKYMAAARKIEAAVKEGDVSKKDAAKKLAEMRESMFRQGESDDRVRDRERDREREERDLNAQKEKYIAAVRRIEAAVKEGEVSKKDAEKRLLELRKRMFRQ